MSDYTSNPTAIGNPATTQYGVSGPQTIAAPTQAPRINYICADCNGNVSLATSDSAVRCNACGGRVLYKQRTTRSVLVCPF